MTQAHGPRDGVKVSTTGDREQQALAYEHHNYYKCKETDRQKEMNSYECSVAQLYAASVSSPLRKTFDRATEPLSLRTTHP